MFKVNHGQVLAGRILPVGNKIQVMRNLALTAIFFLCCSNLFGQPIKLKIIDKSDGKPVQYASVYYKNNKGISAISDTLGQVSIKYISEDSTIITRVGYSELRVASQQLATLSLVYLLRKSNVLPEVILSKNLEDDIEILGSAKRKNGRVSLIPNLEFGRRFRSQTDIASINSVILYYSTIANSSHLFLLSIYSLDENKNLPLNKISEQLFKLDPIEGKANKYKVILDSVVSVPKNFLISVKYLGSQPENSRIEIYFTSRSDESSTYVRYLSDEWVAPKKSIFLRNYYTKETCNMIMQVELLQ